MGFLLSGGWQRPQREAGSRSIGSAREEASPAVLGWSGKNHDQAGPQCASGRPDQCDECPSSLLLVAHRMHEKKTAAITGTTKKGV
jgi:hypothetical protein